MNKYKVKITHVFSEVMDLEAVSEEDAREKAAAELKREDREVKAEYETTIPSEHWPIISEEKYNEIVAAFEAGLVKQYEENKEESNIITP